MIRSELLWIGSGFITAAVVLAVSYAVAPELLQVDLSTEVTSTGSPEPVATETTPVDTETPPIDTEEPTPISTPDDRFAGIPECGKSLLDIGDEEETVTPMPSGDPDSQQCVPSNCSVGGVVYEGGQECIKDGSQECVNAGLPQRVLVHVCPNVITDASECVPQEVEEYTSGGCGANDAPGCADVTLNFKDVTACEVCWTEFAETKSLECRESASGSVSVTSDCRPGPPREGRNGIEVDASGCEYDPARRECFGTCSVTRTESFDCITTETAFGSCTEESATPTPTPTPFSTVSATPTPFVPTPTPLTTPTPTPLLTVTPTPFFPTPTPFPTATPTPSLPTPTPFFPVTPTPFFPTPTFTPFPTTTPASFGSVLVNTFFGALLGFLF